nr:hypothetical protein [Tanacetum cinerariifolium]
MIEEMFAERCPGRGVWTIEVCATEPVSSPPPPVKQDHRQKSKLTCILLKLNNTSSVTYWMKMFPDKIKRHGDFQSKHKEREGKKEAREGEEVDLRLMCVLCFIGTMNLMKLGLPAQAWHETAFSRIASIFEQVSPRKNDDEVDDLNDCFDDEPDRFLFFTEDQIGEKHYNHEAYHGGGWNREDIYDTNGSENMSSHPLARSLTTWGKLLW